MFDLKYLPKGRLYLSTLIGSFCILKDKIALLSLTVFRARKL